MILPQAIIVEFWQVVEQCPSDKGARFREWIKENIVFANELHALFFGGEEFYQSDSWFDVRYRAIKLHGRCCQCCGTTASPSNPIQVDHIKPRSKYPHLALDISNLQILCRDCNLGKRAWDETDWRDSNEVAT